MLRLFAIYKVSLILMVGLTLLYVFQGFYPGFISFFSNAFPPFIAGAAVVSSYFPLRKYWQKAGERSSILWLFFTLGLTLRRRAKERFSMMWLFFTLGLALWFLGETGWAIYTLLLGVETPYPSVADVFWLSGYIPLFMALYLYVKIFESAISRRMLALSVATTLISAVFVSATLMAPILGAEEDLVTSIIDFAYPLFDLVLFSAAFLGLLIFLGGRMERSWLLINGGILSNALADVLFSYTVAQGIYYSGHLLEILFHLGYLLFTLAFNVHVRELDKFSSV